MSKNRYNYFFVAAAALAALLAIFVLALRSRRDKKSMAQVCAAEMKVGAARTAQGYPVTGSYLEDLGGECSQIQAVEAAAEAKSPAVCPGVADYMDCFKQTLRANPPRSVQGLALYIAVPADISLKHKTPVPFDNLANLIDGLMSVMESADTSRFFVNALHPEGVKQQAELARIEAIETQSLEVFKRKAAASIAQMMAKLSVLEPKCGQGPCAPDEAARRAAVYAGLNARFLKIQSVVGDIPARVR